MHSVFSVSRIRTVDNALERDKCVDLFWNLLHHLHEQQPSDQIHHLDNELQSTSRCDDFMPEFREVRNTVLGRLTRCDPELPSRVASLEVSTASRKFAKKTLDVYIRIQIQQRFIIFIQISTQIIICRFKWGVRVPKSIIINQHQ